jgi:hypothetical protein
MDVLGLAVAADQGSARQRNLRGWKPGPGVNACAYLYLRAARRGNQGRPLLITQPQRCGERTQGLSVRRAAPASLQCCYGRRGEVRSLGERRLAQARPQAKLPEQLSER